MLEISALRVGVKRGTDPKRKDSPDGLGTVDHPVAWFRGTVASSACLLAVSSFSRLNS